MPVANCLTQVNPIHKRTGERDSPAILRGQDLPCFLLDVVAPAFDDNIFRGIGANHVSLPLALPFSGTLLLQSLFLGRNRHKTATHGAEAAMKTDFFLVQEKILAAKLNGRKGGILLLPRVSASQIPDLVTVVVIHSTTGSNDELVEIRSKKTLNKGIVSGKTTEHCKLLNRYLLLGVFQVLASRILEKSFMLVQPVKGRGSVRLFTPEGQKLMPLCFESGRDIGYLGHDFPAGTFMQMGEDHPIATLAPDGLSLSAREESQNTRVMANTADKENALVLFPEPLKMVSHSGFTQRILPARLSVSGLIRVRLAVGGVANPLHSIRIRKCFTNLRHRLQISVNEMEGKIMSQSKASSFHHTVGGL